MPTANHGVVKHTASTTTADPLTPCHTTESLRNLSTVSSLHKLLRTFRTNQARTHGPCGTPSTIPRHNCINTTSPHPSIQPTHATTRTHARTHATAVDKRRRVNPRSVVLHNELGRSLPRPARGGQGVRGPRHRLQVSRSLMRLQAAVLGRSLLLLARCGAYIFIRRVKSGPVFVESFGVHTGMIEPFL